MTPSPRKKKILIVEDHQFFRAMLVQLVGSEPDMTVCGQTDNIADALALVEQTRPDVALVDLKLKGSGSLELIANLAARSVRIPVLVISLHPEGTYSERAISAGAAAYVSKQEPPDVVIATIRRLLEGTLKRAWRWHSGGTGS